MTLEATGWYPPCQPYTKENAPPQDLATRQDMLTYVKFGELYNLYSKADSPYYPVAVVTTESGQTCYDGLLFHYWKIADQSEYDPNRNKIIEIFYYFFPTDSTKSLSEVKHHFAFNACDDFSLGQLKITFLSLLLESLRMDLTPQEMLKRRKVIVDELADAKSSNQFLLISKITAQYKKVSKEN